MRRTARRVALLGLGITAGCALKGDVRKVGLEVEALQAQMTRSDSVRRAERDSLLAAIAMVQQALTTQQNYLVQLRGDAKNDHLNIQQQLVSVQELTGQSQQRLSELRSQLEARAAQPVTGPDTSRGGGAAAPGGGGGASADQMYDASLQQYRKGSVATGRSGFRQFLQAFPTDPRAPDALFFIGESFGDQQPDSAAPVYAQVVKTYPNSTRAPTALYKLGLLAEKSDKALARTYFNRVIAGYPRSDEANLARLRLQALGR
ncbi:MAG TPA: tetratricopeptide repeat protein [Gemmatimonadales bacterium]|nr:tetratricopeptide repeat protein [Gemmatimonadales bacterium]